MRLAVAERIASLRGAIAGVRDPGERRLGRHRSPAGGWDVRDYRHTCLSEHRADIVGGDDLYVAADDPTLGAGNYSAELPYGQKRQAASTLGVFVDAGGHDVYTVAGMDRPLDETTWSYAPQPYPSPQTVDSERGCSADVRSVELSLP